ncbi:MAG: arginine decarboxylase, pyruvoyl-dependent [Candidatus Hydrogenedentota bacterium]
MFIPQKLFLTNGVGKHREQLASFELALRDAGIAEFNLVSVSSILPPHCKIIPKKDALALLKPGQIVFTVMSRNSTNEPHRLLAASVGVAIPKDRSNYGYLSEHHSFGQTEKKAGDYAEDLAADMLTTILGVEFDPDESWDKKREIWRISGKIYKTMNVTQTAVGNKNGLWTSVLAAAVFVPDPNELPIQF